MTNKIINTKHNISIYHIYMTLFLICFKWPFQIMLYALSLKAHLRVARHLREPEHP